jgi:hypothetical protein
MWNKNLVVMMTLSLFITLNLLISYHHASAQANETGNNGQIILQVQYLHQIIISLRGLHPIPLV